MNAERELQLTHHAATGRPMAEIGRDLGVTRERVRQLLRDYGLRALWEERSIRAREVQPEPPIRVCHWCGREVEQLPGWRHAHWTHTACTRAYNVYCHRMTARERYRTDPDYRQRKADYQRAHPEQLAAIRARYTENLRADPERYEAVKADWRERSKRWHHAHKGDTEPTKRSFLASRHERLDEPGLEE